MGVKIGIPRALLYYHYSPMWQAFFKVLGAEVIVSGATNKFILNQGLKRAVEDVCLPVKLAFGHVLDLAGRVDYVFIPRLISVARGEYLCPKFLGFPDMVRQIIPGFNGIIDVDIDLYRRQGNLYRAFEKVGQLLNCNRAHIYLAYRRGLAALNAYRRLLAGGLTPDEAISVLQKPGFRSRQPARRSPDDSQVGSQKPVVAVVGHPYNIYDSYISMNILKRLKAAGVDVVTADQLPEAVVRKEAAGLPKRLFWTLGQQMIGAAFHFLRDGRVRGILHVTSFGCGLDSMSSELIERQARFAGTVPLLNLVLDEHTGEAGVVTRLEAFLDMVQGV